MAGEYDLQGGKAASGQETVVFKGSDGLYVLQMNATATSGRARRHSTHWRCGVSHLSTRSGSTRSWV
ncbi:MAG: LpqN/LpqT family lipoprotein [Mycobacterium sp.]|uniref:LpqN/LpqT family lipoprotein n=1 Tax=Mycobacterium sp. TaxID=1785 RepID=UPI003C78236A